MLDRKIEEVLVNRLGEELDTLIIGYRSRMAGLHEQGVTLGDATQITATCMAVGSVAGSAVPLIGNGVGAIAGALIGGAASKALSSHYKRNNKKYHNAQAVIHFLGADQEILMGAVSERVIAERRPLFSFMKNPQGEQETIARFLAVNIIAAMKRAYFANPERVGEWSLDDKIDFLAEGVKRAWSHKNRRHRLSFKEGFSHPVTILADPLLSPANRDLFGFFQPKSRSVLVERKSEEKRSYSASPPSGLG